MRCRKFPHTKSVQIGQSDGSKPLCLIMKNYHFIRYFPAGYSSVHKQRLIEYVERVEEEGGVVAYKCSICQKTSTRRDALTSHIENIHFPGAYKCYYCDLVFNSQNTRNVHIGRKHKFNTNSLGPSALPQLPSSASLQLPAPSIQLPAPTLQLPAPTLQLPAPQIN